MTTANLYQYPPNFNQTFCCCFIHFPKRIANNEKSLLRSLTFLNIEMNLLYYQTSLITIIFIVLSYEQLQVLAYTPETPAQKKKRKEEEAAQEEISIWIACIFVFVWFSGFAWGYFYCWIKYIRKRKAAREALRERIRQNGHGLMPGGHMMMPQAQGILMYQQSGYGYQSVSPIQPIRTQDGQEQQKVQQPQDAPTASPTPPRPVYYKKF